MGFSCSAPGRRETSPNGEETHRPGVDSAQEVKERGVGQLQFSSTGSRVGGPVLPSKLGKREKVLKGGDLDCFGDKLHFGQVEFEGLTGCPSRDNQEVTGYFQISYSKFKGLLSEKPSVAPSLISVSVSTLHVPLSRPYYLFVYLPA